MAERLFHLAAAPFESARRVAILPEGHRARRLHGHSFLDHLLFTLAAFANANDLRLADCIESVLKKYTARDGESWKDNCRNQTRCAS